MCLFLLAFAFGEIWFLSSLIPVVDRQCLALVRQCREKKRSLQQQLPQQPQQQVGQDPNQPQAAGQQGGQTGGYQKEMKMDEKWIPAMPVPGWKFLDFERKRTVRFQGLVGEVQWLVESYP